MINKAVYPGTFDPLTNGHLDIIQRSLKIFDEITILLAINSQKSTLFSLEERIDQLKRVIQAKNLADRVKVDSFAGLIVKYCSLNQIKVIIRGLRPLVDFEYEFEMAMNNRELNHNIETVFIITDQKYFYLRSSLIKDIVKFEGDVTDKVPNTISHDLKQKILLENKDLE